MAKDLWLPKDYELTGGRKVRSLLYSGDEWQIFDTSSSNNILLVQPELANKWREIGFLDNSLFDSVTFGDEFFFCISSPNKFAITPVENGKSPENKVDAMAFAQALKESRKKSANASFHDAIYVEQYSRLLPCWTLTPQVDDEVVLGTWISGGIVISAKSFRRLTSLTGWMPVVDLMEVIDAAGFTVPANLGLQTKKKISTRTRRNETASPSKEISNSEQSTESIEEFQNFQLPGRPQLEKFFMEHVIDIIFNAEKYQVLGIDFPSGIVLHGPPGCGKTFAVERLVEFIDWPSFSINSNNVGSPYIHETSKKISSVFDSAIDASPSVIVIDEMESFLTERRLNSSSGIHRIEEVAEFLRRIPEAINNKVLVIAMTNMIDLIDSAILRRGRFDHVVEVGMPSREEVSSLIDSLMKKLPTVDNIDLDKALDALANKDLSESVFFVREATRLAAKAGKTQLDQECVENALNSLPRATDKKSKHIGFVWNNN